MTALSNNEMPLWNKPSIMTVILITFLFNIVSTCPLSASDKTLTYHIGTMDTDFGLTREEFSKAINKAALIWERSIGRKIFKEVPNGDIEINLVYDHRQASTDNIKAISDNMNGTRASYDDLMDEYNRMKDEVSRENAAYESSYSSYVARLNAFTKEIETAQIKEKLSEEMHKSLKIQKLSLDSQMEVLTSRRSSLDKKISALNNLVSRINHVSSNYNSQVADFKNTYKVIKGEFDAGLYERGMDGERITVFHFNDNTMLVRTLAHELGHAIGIKHSNNPASIMYHLHRSRNLELTPEEISAMQAHYSIK